MEKFTSEKVMSEFQIDNDGRHLYHEVKGLGKLLKRGKSRYSEKCYIFILDSKVIFRVKGSEFYIASNSSGDFRVEVYFTDLLEALEKDRSTNLTFRVQERNFIINERKLLCEAKEMNEIDKNFAIEAGLNALNFGEVNVKTPTWQSEVYKLKSTGEEIHIDTLRRDAEKVALLLKKYKVDSNKVLHLIMENMK